MKTPRLPDPIEATLREITDLRARANLRGLIRASMDYGWSSDLGTPQMAKHDLNQMIKWACRIGPAVHRDALQRRKVT